MNPNLTEIVAIIDRSGSMEAIRDDAIKGFNTFLADQKALPGEARLTLVLFDDQYEVAVEHADLRAAEPLTRQTFVPRGSTALFDAMGRTIDRVGQRLAKTPEDERPSKVVVVTLTDGHENASVEYTQRDVITSPTSGTCTAGTSSSSRPTRTPSPPPPESPSTRPTPSTFAATLMEPPRLLPRCRG